MSVNSFSLQRLSRLIVNDLKLHSKTMLITAITLAIFLSLFSMGGFGVYYIILYLGGFILTSFAFNELHDYRRAHLFLTLPCSNLERFLTKWFLTSIGYAIGVLIIYYVFSLINIAVNSLFYHQVINPLNLLQENLWLSIGKYIILQSIILLGAIVFKKYALIKTALVIASILLILTLFSFSLTWMFCPDCIQSGEFILQNLLHGIYFTFWVIIAPICWYFAYLRLSKYELT